jgi:hypothetical protein
MFYPQKNNSDQPLGATSNIAVIQQNYQILSVLAANLPTAVRLFGKSLMN